MTSSNREAPEFQPEMLSAYLDDELNELERQVVEQRLQSDPSARQTLDELSQIHQLVAALPVWEPRIGTRTGEPLAGLAELDDGLEANRAPKSPAAHGTASTHIDRSSGGNVTPPAGSRRKANWWPQLALVATLLVATGIGFALWSQSPPPAAAVTLETASSPAEDAVGAPAEPMASFRSETDMAADAGAAMPTEDSYSLDEAVESALMEDQRIAPGGARVSSRQAMELGAPSDLPLDFAPPSPLAKAAFADGLVEQSVAPEISGSPSRIAYNASWSRQAILEQLKLHPELASELDLALKLTADASTATESSAAAATLAADAESAAADQPQMAMRAAPTDPPQAGFVAEGTLAAKGELAQLLSDFDLVELPASQLAIAEVASSREAQASSNNSARTIRPTTEASATTGRLVLFVSESQAAAIRAAIGDRMRVVAELAPITTDQPADDNDVAATQPSPVAAVTSAEARRILVLGVSAN